MDVNFPDNEVLAEQIEDVSSVLNIPESVVEKDLYVTKAISVVTKVFNEMYELIFQGGTSLSKAYGLIDRMSEDCDFRIRCKKTATGNSKNKQKKELKKFRHDIVDALKDNKFIIHDSSVRVRNEGQFMAIDAQYPFIFSNEEPMKPHLALEFFLGELNAEPELRPVTSLIGKVIGIESGHASFEVNSLSVLETAAEKWTGLTRRVASRKYKKQYEDKNLVRHIYDLYEIKKKNKLSKEFSSIAIKKIMNDREHYKNHNEKYYNDPKCEIRRAIDELCQSKEWHDNWDRFMKMMVYSKYKPSYQEAIENLVKITDDVLIHFP